MRFGPETNTSAGHHADEIEFEKDDCHGRTESSEERRLLQDFDDISDQEQLEQLPQLRWQTSSRRLWTIGSIAGFLMLIAGLHFVFPNISKNLESGRHEVVTNDYLLDPQWDFSAPPQRREYFWTISDVVHNPDGIFRPMIVVNNQFPGPLIEANEGDTIVVHVQNQAINATSIHWHGIYQNGTPHMDGTVGISQCPIAPGNDFVYEFRVDGQSGTYWWHAHYGVQSSDGIHGPLIIHGRAERQLQQIEYATDRVVLVSDHYHELSSALLWQYLKPDQENSEPVPVGALINGRAKRECDEFPDRVCREKASLTTFDLEPSSKHRLRFINVGAFAEFQVQIDEHELVVTEVDGTDVLPARYHRINIGPAQRYSVIVETTVPNSDQFWLRARMITQCFTDPPDIMQPEVRALVRYEGKGQNSMQGPSSKDWDEVLSDECRDMNSTELVPVHVLAPPESSDAFVYLRSNFEIGAYRLSRGFFNGSSWRPDIRSPTLLRAIDGLRQQDPHFVAPLGNNEGQKATINEAAFDGSRELVVQTTGVQTIDVLVSNFDDGDHPLHLHGYKYWVLAQGHGYPPLTRVGADITKENLQPLYASLDLSNPLRRDTASVEAFGWILLRFIADNPGAWAFHCHLSWHSEAGLLMQFLTRSDDLASFAIPDANKRLCCASNLEMGAGPSDEDYRDLAK